MPRIVARLVANVLGRRFQLERLVRFDEKFLPEWRPRFLVYESVARLPLAATRVLQAEGYLPQLRPQIGRGAARAPRRLPDAPQTDAAR